MKGKKNPIKGKCYKNNKSTEWICYSLLYMTSDSVKTTEAAGKISDENTGGSHAALETLQPTVTVRARQNAALSEQNKMLL